MHRRTQTLVGAGSLREGCYFEALPRQHQLATTPSYVVHVVHREYSHIWLLLSKCYCLLMTDLVGRRQPISVRMSSVYMSAAALSQIGFTSYNF